jgi:hypothetical protein
LIISLREIALRATFSFQKGFRFRGKKLTCGSRRTIFPAFFTLQERNLVERYECQTAREPSG